MFHYKDRSRKLNWCMWNIIILCHIMTLCRLMTLSRIMTRLRRNLPENFRLSPLQLVLNATIHLTASLPHFSHISTFLPKHLNWILLMVSIHFKSLFITYGAFLFQAHTIFWFILKRFCSQPTLSFDLIWSVSVPSPHYLMFSFAVTPRLSLVALFAPWTSMTS